MTPENLLSTIKTLYALPNRRALCIEGPPGIGKTSITGQAARELNVHYIERHLPTMPIEDFGVPDLLNNTTQAFGYKLPEWFPSKGSKWDDGRGGILCMDDRNQANQEIQKVLANILQARNLHGVPLADNWMVISTGNRMSDRAGVVRVLSHLSNREDIVELDVSIGDFTRWASSNGVREEVISFLNARPALLHNFDPTAEERAQPTPRSWVEGISWKMGRLPKNVEAEVFRGAVGKAATAEFIGYLKQREAIDPIDVIMANPKTARVPEKTDLMWAAAGMVAAQANKSNFDVVMTYLNRFPKEFGTLGVTYATRRDPEVMETDAFVQWSIANQSTLF